MHHRHPSLPAAMYLLEQKTVDEPVPVHPGLPPVSGTLAVDGTTYWVVGRPEGTPLAEFLRAGAAGPQMALRWTRQLGEALLVLGGLGIYPGDFYRWTFWSGDRLVLDYCGAVLAADEPAFPQVGLCAGERATTVTLGAILHGCLTGKPATDSPYVFLPPERVPGPSSGDLVAAVAAGLSGTMPLKVFLDRLGDLEGGLRLAALFPPVAAGAELAGPLPAVAVPKSAGRQRLFDVLFRIICFAAGLAILARCD